MSLFAKVCLVASMGWVTGQRGGAQPPPPPAAVHIMVRVTDLSGAPVEFLRPRDFKIVSAGQPRPVALDATAAALPVRVLMLFGPRSSLGNARSIRQMLRKNLPATLRGAEMRVELENGLRTTYTSRRDVLVSDLRGDADASRGHWDSLRSLARYPGRRAVVYVTGPGVRVPLELQKAADALMAEVYHVGGDVFDNHSYTGQVVGMPSLPAYGEGAYGASFAPDTPFDVVNNAQTSESFAAENIGTVHVERSLRGALHDLARDGRGYYNLSVSPGAAVEPMALRVHLTEDFQVAARAYRQDGGTAPVLTLQTHR